MSILVRSAVVWLFLALFSGCVTGRSKEIILVSDVNPVPQSWTSAQESPEACISRPPKKQISPKFSYGCFCGEGYPGFALNGPQTGDVSSEKIQLVAKYYGTKPVDEIDAACQEHDICYVLNDGAEYGCDSVLDDRLDSYDAEVAKLVGTFEINTPEWRCRMLARDIHMASMSLFPSGSKQWLMGTTMRTFKIIALPLTALYTLTTVAAWDNYPKKHFCDLDVLRARGYDGFYEDR